MSKEKVHPEISFGKTGVLLVNLGTPDSTNWWDIRKYLKEFLSDKRVIEVIPKISFNRKKTIPVMVRIDFTCCLHNEKFSPSNY